MTNTRFPVTFTSLAMLGGLWVVAAWLTDDPTTLPSPWIVGGLIWKLAQTGELATHVLATLGRVAAAFALAMGIGSVLGVVMGRSAALDRWMAPWITMLLNVPALVVIVLCYLWIGLNETAAIVAVAVNKTAMVAVTLREGVRAMDPALDDMARVQRMSRIAWARHILWPQLAPFVASATRNGLAIIWKIVLVVEFLGRSNGVGFQIHLYFSLFETGYVLAYALSFVAVMFVIEYGVVQSWERRATRWRRAGLQRA